MLNPRIDTIVPMNLFSQFLRKYNGHLAAVLALTMVISGSMEIAHDHLEEHDHGTECPMFMVDGSTTGPASDNSTCSPVKQTIQAVPFTPIALVLNAVENQHARAPPVSL